MIATPFMIEAGVAALNACAGNQLPPDQAVARVYSAMCAARRREVAEEVDAFIAAISPPILKDSK